jgi:hypothetical protein
MTAYAPMNHAVAHHGIRPIRAVPEYHGKASIVASHIRVVSGWLGRLLAMPYDHRPVLKPRIRAERPDLMDSEVEQEALAGNRQLRPVLGVQLLVQQRGHVELRARGELRERPLRGVALVPESLHEVLVGGDLVWA